MTIQYHTLGCKVNTFETDRLRRECAALGFQPASPGKTADVVVINTCSVTKQSDRKSAQLIRAALRQGSTVVAMGCFVPEEAIENVLFIANEDKDRAAERIREHVGLTEATPSDVPETERTRSFIKVQDGCNNFCSYCIIPYLRGREKSLPEVEIMKEVRGAIERGHREIVLSGIHLSGYGRDTGTELIQLIERIGQLDGVDRIRLGSLEQAVITSEFLSRAKAVKAFCPHFHLSLQSGSAGVLKRMNRHYLPEEFLATMALIRQVFPDAAITTDIIVGFSGETVAEFQETMDFVRNARFNKVHIFPYSKRQGTRAALLKDLPMDLKRQRAKELRDLTEAIQAELLDAWLGRDVEVLTETDHGYTKQYLPVYYEEDLEPNQLVVMHITRREELSLYGMPILQDH